MANEFSGLLGNMLPIVTPSTSDSYDLDYPVQALWRRNVVALSCNAHTIASSQSGTVFTYGGLASGIVITLPKPQKGTWFEFIATGVISTLGTKFTCADPTGAFVTIGDSGGADSILASSTLIEFAIAGPGCYMEFIGLSTSKYLARQTKSGSSAASTGMFEISC